MCQVLTWAGQVPCNPFLHVNLGVYQYAEARCTREGRHLAIPFHRISSVM